MSELFSHLKMTEESQAEFWQMMSELGIKADDEDPLWRIILALRWNVALMEAVPKQMQDAIRTDQNTVNELVDQVLETADDIAKRDSWRYIVGMGVAFGLAFLISVAAVGALMWSMMQLRYEEQLQDEIKRLSTAWERSADSVQWGGSLASIPYDASKAQAFRYIDSLYSRSYDSGLPYPCLDHSSRQWTLDGVPVQTCTIIYRQ